MKAAVLYRPGDMRVEERPGPGSPAEGWVRLRVDAVGICGSDLHYYREGRIGSFVVEAPLVLGHEAAGTVLEVGPGVHDLSVGQRVAIEPGVPCGRCAYCRMGRYNLCPDVVFHATPPVDGSLAEEIVHPATYCYPVPDTLTQWQAALAEPMSVGIQAIRLGAIRLGERVLITGAGSVGLLTALAVRQTGAEVALVDVDQGRLTVAEHLGFRTLAFAAWSGGDEAWDCGLECSGNEEATRRLLEAIRPGGRVVLVGMHAAPQFELPVFAILRKEVAVHGVFRYANTYPTALRTLGAVRTWLTPFGQRVEPLEAAPDVFQAFAGGQIRQVKVVISPSGLAG